MPSYEIIKDFHDKVKTLLKHSVQELPHSLDFYSVEIQIQQLLQQFQTAFIQYLLNQVFTTPTFLKILKSARVLMPILSIPLLSTLRILLRAM